MIPNLIRSLKARSLWLVPHVLMVEGADSLGKVCVI